MRIEAEALVLRYRDRAALAGVSCALKPGELVGLIGPNGAGKSTLIRVIAGLRKADEGAISYDGRPAATVPRAELARRIAYLAQSGGADWPLSVEHVVALGRLPHRVPFAAPSAADRAAIERAMQSAEVAEFRHRTLAELSGGERARVLLARALAVEAEMLLADEPIAALDPLHQLRAMELLRAVVDRGAGVVAVLHDLTLAVRFCDRLIVMRDGRVIADGKPAVLDARVLAQAYGIEALRGEQDGRPWLVPWRAAKVELEG